MVGVLKCAVRSHGAQLIKLAAKARFENITSIHIYTLEPNSIDDLQILTNCNREIAAKYASEDPLEAWKQYGTIQNPNVKVGNS